MVVERVSGILIHLQWRQWTGTTNDMEDRLVDAWLSRSRGREAVAEEVFNVWISVLQSGSQPRSRYGGTVSGRSFVKFVKFFKRRWFVIPGSFKAQVTAPSCF